MRKMIIKYADNKEKEGLIDYFKHYNNYGIIKNRIECYIKHNKTLLAKENNKIIGVLQWHVKENPNAGVAEFEEFFVSREHRGKGIGSQLVDYAIRDIKKHFISINIKPRKIFLFVSKDNNNARKLYEKHGFRFIAELNDLFSDDNNELFYCLDL